MDATIGTAPSRPSPQSTPWPSCVSDRYLHFTRKLELPCAKRGAGMILDRSGRATRALRPRRLAGSAVLVRTAHVLPTCARISIRQRPIPARTRTRALRPQRLARVTILVRRAHVPSACAAIAVRRRPIRARTRTSECAQQQMKHLKKQTN